MAAELDEGLRTIAFSRDVFDDPVTPVGVANPIAAADFIAFDPLLRAGRQLQPRRLLLEREPVGVVAVDLVRRGEHERRRRSVSVRVPQGHWMAGAGVKPGIEYGKTDDHCYNIVESPVHIRDMNATIPVKQQI